MEIIFIILFMLLVLWLGSKILEKAGLSTAWTFCLLIPIVNIMMIWIFAFSHWPRLKPDVNQDL